MKPNTWYDKSFFTYEKVKRAAQYWGCGMHEAEMKLMRGEITKEGYSE